MAVPKRKKSTSRKKTYNISNFYLEKKKLLCSECRSKLHVQCMVFPNAVGLNKKYWQPGCIFF